MATMFENFDIWMDNTFEDDKPFMVGCRDRERMNEERWIFTHLSKEQAERVHDYLNEKLKELERS